VSNKKPEIEIPGNQLMSMEILILSDYVLGIPTWSKRQNSNNTKYEALMFFKY